MSNVANGPHVHFLRLQSSFEQFLIWGCFDLDMDNLYLSDFNLKTPCNLFSPLFVFTHQRFLIHAAPGKPTSDPSCYTDAGFSDLNRTYSMKPFVDLSSNTDWVQLHYWKSDCLIDQEFIKYSVHLLLFRYLRDY